MFWVEALKESLSRAGDHIAPDAPIDSGVSELGDHYRLKLWHTLPKGGKSYVTQYIKLFAKEHQWKVIKVNHSKFYIEIIARPVL
jgi:hypothetical protein